MDDEELLELTHYSDPGLSKSQIAADLHTSESTLDRLHARGEGPPRFKVNSRTWIYPLSGYLAWKKARVAAAQKEQETYAPSPKNVERGKRGARIRWDKHRKAKAAEASA